MNRKIAQSLEYTKYAENGTYFVRTRKHDNLVIVSEIAKVRLSLFQFEFNKDVIVLPDGEGPILTMQEKVYVPAKDYPDVCFVVRFY